MCLHWASKDCSGLNAVCFAYCLEGHKPLIIALTAHRGVAFMEEYHPQHPTMLLLKPSSRFCFLVEDNDTTGFYEMSSQHWCLSVWQKKMRPLWLKPQPDLRGFAGKVLCCSLWPNKFFVMIPYAMCVPLTVLHPLWSHRITKTALTHWLVTFKDTAQFFDSETSKNASKDLQPTRNTQRRLCFSFFCFCQHFSVWTVVAISCFILS